MSQISREIGDFFYLLKIGVVLVVYVVFASNYVEVPGLEAKVSAQNAVRTSTLTEIVEGNVYLFTPGNDGETSDDVQLDRVLRNFGDKYRITGLVITERKRNVGSDIVLVGIAQARIIVESK